MACEISDGSYSPEAGGNWEDGEGVTEGIPGWQVPDPTVSLPRGYKGEGKPGSGEGWTKGKVVWESCLPGMGVQARGSQRLWDIPVIGSKQHLLPEVGHNSPLPPQLSWFQPTAVPSYP